MTTPAEYRCDEQEARALVVQWHSTVERAYLILERAQEGRAWEALGYRSWRAFAQQELNVSQSRAYQLLDMAKVVREIEVAGSTSVELTEAAARDLKPHLPAVADAVREAVADVPEAERPAVAAQAVKDARARLRPPTSSAEPSQPAEERPAPTATGAGSPTCADGAHIAAGLHNESRCAAPVEHLPIERHPDYQDGPSTADLDAELDQQLDSTDERYRLNLARAIVAAQSVLDLAPHRAVQTYQRDSDEALVLDAFLDRMDAWTSAVRSGLRPNLRSVR